MVAMNVGTDLSANLEIYGQRWRYGKEPEFLSAPRPDGDSILGEPALGYTRQSQGSKKSLEDQETDLLEDEQEEGYRFVEILSDSIGATNAEDKLREGWDRLLLKLDETDIKLLVVWEFSRADRKADVLLPFIRQCKKRDVRIRIQKEKRTFNPRVSGDWKALADMAVDSEWEMHVLVQRTQRGLRKNLAKGIPYSVAPYGYIDNHHPKSGKFVSRVPDTRPVILADGTVTSASDVMRLMLEQAAAGVSVAQIVKGLNSSKIPTARDHEAILDGREVKGFKWRVTTVTDLIRNPAHTGVLAVKGTVYAVECWEALVSVEKWHDAITSIAARRPLRSRGKLPMNLLSGIAGCFCGGKLAMYRRKTRNQDIEDSRYFHCRNSSQYGEIGAGQHIRGITAKRVEVFVEQTLLAYVSSPKFVALVRGDIDVQRKREHEENLAKAREMRETIERWRQRARSAASLGGEAARKVEDDYEAVMRDLSPQVAELERVSAPNAVSAMAARLASASAALEWESLDMRQRRQVVAELFSIVVTFPGSSNRPVNEYVTVTPRLT